MVMAGIPSSQVVSPYILLITLQAGDGNLIPIRQIKRLSYREAGDSPDPPR